MKRFQLSVLLPLFLLLALVGCTTPTQEASKALSVSQFSAEYLNPGDYAAVTVSSGYKYPGDYQRQVLVLSLFSPSGEPISMDGSSTTLSTYDLVKEETDLHPILHKAIQGHQAVYVPERPLDSVTLLMNGDAPIHALGTVIQLDVFLQRQDDSSGAWITVASESRVLRNGATNIPEPAQDPAIPQLTNTAGFRWEIKNGEALLTGLGTVLETDLYLPDKVCLSPGPQVPDAYICTPSSVSSKCADSHLGTAYDLVCLDGTLLSDPLLLFSETVYLSSVKVYDAAVFASDYSAGMIPGGKLVLPSGTYFLPSAVGYTIDPGSYSKSNPLQLIFLSNAADFRYIEDPLNGTEYPVVIQGDAFANCDRIQTVTFSPTSRLLENKMRWSGGGMFSGCDNLTAVYAIPQAVTDMHRAFENCTKLSVTPELPPAVTDLSRCFYGCSSLPHVPEIPGSVSNLYYAFYECNSLTGIATIPLSTIDPTDNLTVYCAFKHCPNLEQVCFDACPLYPYAAYATNLTVEYLREHVSTGTCAYCKTINHQVYKVDGITIVADSIPTALYDEVVSFVEDSVPELLKEECNRITLTTDLSKYISDSDLDLSIVLGYATDPGCDMYILVDPEGSVPMQTLYHEFAHCYDFGYSTATYFSDSEQWRALHQTEGEYAKLWYDQASYHSYDQTSQQMETFAIAVSCYFTHPAWLLNYCPGMYAYMKTLFS